MRNKLQRKLSKFNGKVAARKAVRGLRRFARRSRSSAKKLIEAADGAEALADSIELSAKE